MILALLTFASGIILGFGVGLGTGIWAGERDARHT